MSYNPILIVGVVSGTIVLATVFWVNPVLAIIFAAVVISVGVTLQRILDRPDKFAQQYGGADILNRMWFPLQDELTDVVKNRGRVTEAASAWTTAPGLSKRESPRAFYRGMEEYVGQRKFVASLAGGDLATEESQQQLMAEQQRLLSRAQKLLESVDKAIKAIPGSEKIVRRPRRARPRPAAQRPRSAATGRSATTRQPTRAHRSAQTQAPTPARTGFERPAPSRPAPAPLRIAETPTKPSAPSTPSQPTPLRITDTPTPPSPAVPPPAPRVPEPPPPPAPSPVTVSVPEPAEPVRPPEPVLATPVPSEPDPVSQTSGPPDGLRLDVASVCEEIFDPKIMSYEANRLFDDRYKDATVRWKGTARRASTYSYDFEFGDGGGTKAELDVYEVKQQYGSRTVKAFVQLPTDAAAEIAARIGEDIEFEGRLLTCEGSARRLYVADARMLD